VTLIVALAATGYLVYLSTVVRNRYNASLVNCANCTAVKEAVAANWQSVESRIESLKAAGKKREAEKFAREHANERPLNIEVPCSDCDTPAPDYSLSAATAVVGFIASMVLFGVAKPRR
jgi:hypothetical protein